ncbi:MAG: hypothetical protein HC915_18325 [Anaerolineae bacterium]|nr:hypothetical protein [Anaerolineae bacterium]
MGWPPAVGGRRPGRWVQGWWQVVDARGNAFSSEPQRVIYADTRRVWELTEGERVRVYTYRQPRAWAVEMATQADLALAALEAAYGDRLPLPPLLVFYNQASDAALDLGSTTWAPLTMR